MTRMERHVGLALFVTFLLVAAACGDSGTTTTATPATPATPATTTEPAAPATTTEPAANVPNNGTQFVVAWSPVSDPFNPDRQALDDHIEEGVVGAGMAFEYCSPSATAGGAVGDPVLQANCLEQFILKNVDAIVTHAVDVVALAPTIKKAEDAGIPVFLWAGALDAGLGADPLMSYAHPNKISANAGGELLVEFLTQKYGSPKGKVLNVQGSMTTRDGIERSGHFLEIIEKYPDIEVTSKAADWDASKAADIIQDWMTGNPDTDGIWMGSQAGYQDGAESALTRNNTWLKSEDPNHVWLGGPDGSNLGLYALKCGYIDYLSDQAYQHVDTIFIGAIVDFLKSGVLPKAGDTFSAPEPFKTASVSSNPELAGLLLSVDPVTVTTDNVGVPGLWGNSTGFTPNGTSACEE